MSILDSIGGYLGARKQRKTAKRGRKFMEGQLGEARGNIQDQLSALFGEGGSIPGLYGEAEGNLRTGVGEASNILSQGYGQAGDTARTEMGKAIGMLDPYAQGGANAFDLYNRTLSGDSEAFDSFRQGTGYQFLQDEMQQATQRQFGAQGKTGSGNVLAALQDRSAGLASQSFNDYMSQLMGSAQMGQQASTTQAGMQESLAQYLSNLQTGGAGAQASLKTGLGSALAELGVSQAALETGVRQGVIGNEYGMATNALGQIGQFYGLQGAAQAQEMTAAGGMATDIASIIAGNPFSQTADMGYSSENMWSDPFRV